MTEGLTELRGLLQSQVNSSENAVRNLVSSSSQVSQSKKDMENIGSDLQLSNRLISKYERRELTDKVLILLASLLYFGVVLYILQKRLLGWLW